MAVTIAALTYACEFGDERGAWLERLAASRTADAGGFTPAPEVPRKARRQLSRSALLAIDSAQRLAVPLDRRHLAVFSACATGREVALPFVFSLSEASRSAAESTNLVDRVLADQAGGHVVDYLRYSSGTLPGHVAKYAGLRGPNACFSGRAASFFALRKAVLALESGRLDYAVVVGAESLDEAQLSRARPGVLPRELGVAVLLARPTVRRGLQLSLRQTGAPTATPFVHFEAVVDLARLASAVEQLRGMSCDVPVELPTGQRFRWSLDPCDA